MSQALQCRVQELQRQQSALQAECRAEAARGRELHGQQAQERGAWQQQLSAQQAAWERRLAEQEAGYEQRLRQAAQQLAAEKEEARAKHARELDLIEARLQQVVARKDGTIQALKSELHGLGAKLRQFELLAAGGVQ